MNWNLKQDRKKNCCTKRFGAKILEKYFDLSTNTRWFEKCQKCVIYTEFFFHKFSRKERNMNTYLSEANRFDHVKRSIDRLVT